MNKTILALAAAAAGAFLTIGALADVKLVQRVTISNEQLTAMVASMSPEQKAQMAQLGFSQNQTVTTYMKGTQARTDFGQSTLIVDGTHHTITQINRLARTYSVQPYNSAGRMGGAKPVVVDTGQTKTVLGRMTHRYTLKVSSPNAPGGVSGELWVAPGLPAFPFALVPGGALQNGLSQVKGLPLLANVTLHGGQGGKTVVHSVAQSVSVAPLPASVFSLPPGYTKTPPGTSPLPGAFGGGFGGQ